MSRDEHFKRQHQAKDRPKEMAHPWKATARQIVVDFFAKADREDFGGGHVTVSYVLEWVDKFLAEKTAQLRGDLDREISLRIDAERAYHEEVKETARLKRRLNAIEQVMFCAWEPGAVTRVAENEIVAKPAPQSVRQLYDRMVAAEAKVIELQS